MTLPTTSWLAARFGRSRLFFAAVGGFTLFSLFCGMADSLAVEVLLRIGQGACGAFLIPLSQAIMLDIYPREDHGKAMALWGGVSGAMTVELGTAGETRDAVIEAIDTLGTGGGFILSPVDNLREDTPNAQANTEVFIDTWKQHRQLNSELAKV